MDSDDDFLDDGIDFDSIPAGTLLQLEQSAWQATQASPPQYDERSHSTGAQTNRNQLNRDRAPPPQRRQSSFYGDVEVIDLDADILEGNDAPLEDVVNSNPPVTQNALHDHTLGQKQYIPVQIRHHAQSAQAPNIHYPDGDIGARIEEVTPPDWSR